MNTNSYERSKDKSPAYFVSEYGVLKEANWDPNNPPAGHRPLYWKREPLTKEQLKDLFTQAEGKPARFARLIEKAHGIS